VTELGLLARYLHLSASLLVVGSAMMLLLAGPSDRPTAMRWQARIAGCSRGLAWLALGAGFGALSYQAAVLEGRAAAALEPAALTRVAFETRFGAAWLVRQGLLLILAVFLTLRVDLRRRADWRAARGETLLLGGLILAGLGAAGHAAAVEPSAAATLAADIVHTLAAAMWGGGLPALALLLVLAARESGADARPYAVLAARRFSRTALALVLVLAATGTVIAIAHVGSFGALLGTPYGRWLVGKLALFVLVLGLGAAARRWLLPALSGPAAAVGRPAMRRLGASVALEATLVLAIVAIVTVLNASPPARHEQPWWPLSFRLAITALRDNPDAWPFVLVGSQIAVLGCVVIAVSFLLRASRLAIRAGGAVLVLAGGAMALPMLATDAYPTTYQRPTMPYQAAAIARGGELYAKECATCHGARGAGDGPASRALTPPPPDLRAHHAALHTAGDLYWWITHGLRQMPAFGQRLDDAQRWTLVNYIRALGAAEGARRLGPGIEPDKPWLVAPDFTFAVGPAPARALRDYRGARIVLLVLYTLPDSRARLAELAARYDLLVPLGVEVIAVPTDAAPDAIARLGAEPRLFFPVVTDGAADIVATYGLLASGPHVEFLVDRQGYLRAIDRTPGGLQQLLTNVVALNDEKVALAPPGEHVH
jgi:putative copper export protein/mono/diheme cytochrome c family protein